MKKLGHFALMTTLVSTSILSLIGYLGNVHWIFDLFVHFKLQYLIVLILGLITLSFIRKEKMFLLFLIPIFTNLYDVSSIYFGGNHDESIEKSLKICSVNVLSSNNEFEKVEELIKEENPDILILQEVTANWLLKLKKSLTEYEYRKEIPREDNFGIALYSKKPLDEIETLDLGTFDVPSIQCKVKTKQGSVNIIATHPPPPVGKLYTESRNNQLNDLAKLTSNTTENFVILGDLNTSSYSNRFKALLKSGKLFDSRKGLGIQSSWPTWFPPASTTLDHCLVTKNVIIKSRKTGMDVGSDHLPVIVEIGLTNHSKNQPE